MIALKYITCRPEIKPIEFSTKHRIVKCTKTYSREIIQAKAKKQISAAFKLKGFLLSCIIHPVGYFLYYIISVQLKKLIPKPLLLKREGAPESPSLPKRGI